MRETSQFNRKERMRANHFGPVPIPRIIDMEKAHLSIATADFSKRGVVDRNGGVDQPRHCYRIQRSYRVEVRKVKSKHVFSFFCSEGRSTRERRENSPTLMPDECALLDAV